MSEQNKPQLNEEQLYMLAMSALLTETNEQKHDALYGDYDAGNAKEVATKVLEEAWDVTGKDDLMDVIEWLFSEGHRVEYLSDLAEGVITDPEEWPEHIDAWYFCRAISLARWGAAAGYIADEEAWNQIRMCAGYLETRFNSFKEIGENYLHGFENWASDEFYEEVYDVFEESFDWLLDAENKESPWLNIEWGYYERQK